MKGPPPRLFYTKDLTKRWSRPRAAVLSIFACVQPVNPQPRAPRSRRLIFLSLGLAFSVMAYPMQLVPPSLDRLPSYVAALKRGWSPENIKVPAVSIEELGHIEKDPRSFVESLTDREAKGPPILLPDGSSAARLPGFRLWLWDTEFCGSIGLRWQPGTSE